MQNMSDYYKLADLIYEEHSECLFSMIENLKKDDPQKLLEITKKLEESEWIEEAIKELQI